MKVHHLNCISSCPLGGCLMDAGPESILKRGELTNHCLLIECGTELVLVDTGFGLNEVRNPHSRLSSFFLGLVSPDFKEELTAIRQIERLGFNPQDVRHVVLTHLDFDHAGGLDDFPWATVHLMKAERDSAFAQETWLDRQRYRPQQWGTQKNWKFYQAGEGEAWFGFDRVHSLEGVADDIAMVPLIGHSLGHAGIAVQSESRWLFNAGDAYFYREEMNLNKPHCTPGLQTYQLMMDKDRTARLWNQDRLRALKLNHPNEVQIFCAHDVVEFERLSGRNPGIPASEIMQDIIDSNHSDFSISDL